jgi:ABC-type transporter Mla subunit MlaD
VSSVPGARARSVPARSRMTLRRSEAPLVRGGQLAGALRSSREALTSLEDQLDALLAAVRAPRADDALRTAAARVSGATSDASEALARLGTLARRR